MIYSMIIRQVAPGKMGEYREFETKELLPIFEKKGIKMVAHFSTAIGNASETVALLAFDDMTSWQKMREERRTDPEFQKALAKLNLMTVKANSRLLMPSEWSPMK